METFGVSETLKVYLEVVTSMMPEWMTGGRECRRDMGVVLAGVLAAMALAAVLAAVAMAAPRLGFIHIRTNLSLTQDLISARPDLEVSSNGDRVTVVWTEGYQQDLSHGHVYLRAASESGSGWGNKVEVFHGDNSICAAEAAVAVRGTTAHVAYIVGRGGEAYGCAIPDYYQVRYKTCSLTGGTCSSGEGDEIVSVSASANSILEVDLAVDDSGIPHLVWSQGDGQGDNAAIHYKYKSGSWQSGADVATTGDNRAPAIAWSDGHAHVVWRKQDTSQIYYKRSSDPSSPWSNTLLKGGPHLGDPAVAASGNRVLLTWDQCTTSSSGQDCEKYYLVYLRSNNNGSTWTSTDPLEVGTDHIPTNYSEEYDSIDNTTGPNWSVYLVSLQPSVALNDDGWPAVVWHVDSSGGSGNEYTIYYTYAISGTSSAVDWVFTSTVLNEYHPSWMGSAAVGVAGSGEEQHLHVAYMRKPSKASTDAWDVWYDSNERDHYKYIYLPLIFRNG